MTWSHQKQESNNAPSSSVLSVFVLVNTVAFVVAFKRHNTLASRPQLDYMKLLQPNKQHNFEVNLRSVKPILHIINNCSHGLHETNLRDVIMTKIRTRSHRRGACVPDVYKNHHSRNTETKQSRKQHNNFIITSL